jgi:hypothetical protein
MISFLREDALDELSGGGLRFHGLSVYDDRNSLAHSAGCDATGGISWNGATKVQVRQTARARR